MISTLKNSLQSTVAAMCVISFWSQPALAEPVSPVSDDAAVDAAPSATSQTRAAKKSKSAKKKKGSNRGERETEGTEAPDRFEANTVIKSRYQLNGQPLEVDPD